MVKKAYRKRKGWYLQGFYATRKAAEGAATVLKGKGYQTSITRISEVTGKLHPAIYQLSFKKKKRRRKPC